MTANTWPDPARPGVPLNPEKDEWHWLLAPDGEQFPCLWSVIGVSQRERFPMGWISDPESWSPEECTYLGPVLTPDEASALQKRVAELERLVKILMDSDPWDYRAADNVTVLDVWRKEARAALEGKKG